MSRISLTLIVLFIVSLQNIHLYAQEENPEETLHIGYIPIMVMEQHFVAQDQGWYDELGIQVRASRFISGTPIVQAFANKALDAAYVGINPALVMTSRNLPVRVIAANVHDSLSVIASDSFATLWEQDPSAEAFKRFEAETQHKLRITTLAQGSTPDTVLRLWLSQMGLSADDVEIIPLGVAQVQEALEEGRVDASVIMEPIISLAEQQDWGYQTIVHAEDILGLQPGAVFIVTQDLIDNRPELVQALVEIHVRATNYANANPEEAARIASEQIGVYDLSPEIALVAAQSQALNWISDPRMIFESTQAYNEFQVQLGVFSEPIDLDELFDFTFYDAVIAEHPEWADTNPYIEQEEDKQD